MLTFQKTTQIISYARLENKIHDQDHRVCQKTSPTSHEVAKLKEIETNNFIFKAIKRSSIRIEKEGKKLAFISKN